MIAPLFILVLIPLGQIQTSDLKTDEVLVFLPTLGRLVDGGKVWEVRIHGWVYEPGFSGVAAAGLRAALGLGDLEMDDEAESVFRRRARSFLVDNERGKRIVIKLAGRTFRLDPSAPNGHFFGTVRLEAGPVDHLFVGRVSPAFVCWPKSRRVEPALRLGGYLRPALRRKARELRGVPGITMQSIASKVVPSFNDPRSTSSIVSPRCNALSPNARLISAVENLSTKSSIPSPPGLLQSQSFASEGAVTSAIDA